METSTHDHYSDGAANDSPISSLSFPLKEVPTMHDLHYNWCGCAHLRGDGYPRFSGWAMDHWYSDDHLPSPHILLHLVLHPE